MADGREPCVWRIPFENVVFGPLRAIDHYFGESSGATVAKSAFLRLLEQSVDRSDKLLNEIPERALEHPLVKAATLEVTSRREILRMLSQEAHATQREDGLHVEVYGDGIENVHKNRMFMERIKGHHEGIMSGWFEMSDGYPFADDDSGIGPARKILGAWARIPYC